MIQRKKPTRKRSKTTKAKLIAKLDAVFSEFIRLRDSDTNGNCKCCTCSTVKPWREMHAGHYVGRGAMNTRFEEQNVHAQCCGCNTFHEGRKPEYTIFLQEWYGESIIGKLVSAGHITKKWAPIELEALIAHYKGEVARMKNK
ncbi:MAG: recombination protein NinG [Dehalococcoidia bacterium]|jgi:hypothetical protein